MNILSRDIFFDTKGIRTIRNVCLQYSVPATIDENKIQRTTVPLGYPKSRLKNTSIMRYKETHKS